jgi:succinate dehydrogenase / fumarate reductase iron-sulfur subunit
MTAQPKHARNGERKPRSKPVQPGHMPVSEFAFDRPGAGSPFGDDIEFPIPVERLTYEHPDEQ